MVQAICPVLHAAVGVQAAPVVQAAQAPALHTRFWPQDAPSLTLLPESVQLGVPPAQESVPVWHLLVGVQAMPALQATHWPPLHTLLAPQSEPSGAFPDTVQTGVPDVQLKVPALHVTLGSQA